MTRLIKIGFVFIVNFLLLGFSSNAQNNISSYQYWFDNDYSSQIFTTISPTENLQLDFAVPITTLADGLHIFNIRFRDDNFRWSVTSSQFFYYNNLIDNNINAYQYWFDNDYSSQIHTMVSPTENLQLDFAVPLASLADGLHIFNIRFRDDNERWSVTSSQFFYYTNLTDNNINAYRYWFDNDINTNTLVAITPTQQMQLTESIPIEDIEEGLHIFSISFKDNKGKWSIPVNQYFYKTNHVVDNTITAYRYWINDDFDNATYVSISSSTQLLNLSEDIDFPGLGLGDYTIHFQFKDSSDNWSLVTSDDFSLTSLSVIENTFGPQFRAQPNPSFGNTNIELGDSYQEVEVSIFDLLGKEMMHKTYHNTNKIKLETQQFTTGVYIVNVQANTNRASLKLVVK